MIVPTILVTIIFSIIGTLQLFAEPYLMINLARNLINSHFTPNLYAYTLAFTAQQIQLFGGDLFSAWRRDGGVSYAFMLVANRGDRP